MTFITAIATSSSFRKLGLLYLGVTHMFLCVYILNKSLFWSKYFWSTLVMSNSCYHSVFINLTVIRACDLLECLDTQGYINNTPIYNIGK